MKYDVVVGDHTDFYSTIELSQKLNAKFLPVEVKSYGADEVKPIIKVKAELSYPELFPGKEDLEDARILVAFRDDRMRPDSNKYLALNELAVDAIRRIEDDNSIDVLMPYMYYARQHEVFTEGEPLSIETLAERINSWGIDNLYTFNSHLYGRPEGETLRDRFSRSVSVHDIGIGKMFAEKLRTSYHMHDPVIVLPDSALEGLKRIRDFVEGFSDYRIGYTVQRRNRDTGKKKIVASNLDEIAYRHKSSKNDVVIIDDLAESGGTIGRTFKEVCKYKPDSIHIAVGHMVSSKAVRSLSGLRKKHKRNIKSVMTTNSMETKVLSHSVEAEAFLNAITELGTVDLFAEYVSNL